MDNLYAAVFAASALGGSGGTEVVANPTLQGTEADLTGLQVGDTKYAIDTGTAVVANPTLQGDEASLTGLQVGDTKYSVGGGGGGSLYQHNLNIQGGNAFTSPTLSTFGSAVLVTNSAIPFTIATLAAYLYNNGLTSSNNRFNCSGWLTNSTNTQYIMCGMFSTDGQKITILSKDLSSGSMNADFSYMRWFADTVVQIS